MNHFTHGGSQQPVFGNRTRKGMPGAFFELFKKRTIFGQIPEKQGSTDVDPEQLALRIQLEAIEGRARVRNVKECMLFSTQYIVACQKIAQAIERKHHFYKCNILMELKTVFVRSARQQMPYMNSIQAYPEILGKRGSH